MEIQSKGLLRTSALIFLLTFAAYAYVINCGFIWDDNAHVFMDPADWRLENLWRIWFARATQQYYPLTYSSFWLEGNLWGTNPAASHLVNVLFHSLNATLIYAALARLGVKGAWLAGLIFALHPVHAESVAWISERKNVLSGFFYLLAFLSYIEFDSSASRRWYFASLALFLCALLSKTVASTFPAALIIVLWMTGRINFRRAGYLIPFFILALVFGLITIWWETNVVGASGSSFEMGYAARLMLAGRVVWFYIMKLLYPAELIFIYPRWQIDPSIAWQWVFIAAALAAGAFLFLKSAVLGRKPFAAYAFFVVTLFPALGFFNVYPFKFSFVADHFQYLASVGPIALFSSVAVSAAEKARERWGLTARLKQVLPAVLLTVLGALTFSQTFIYRDEETVWQDTLAKNPDAWIAHNNIGLGYLSRGEYIPALGYFEKAYELNASDAIVNHNLGLSLFNIGIGADGPSSAYNERAIAHFREALRIKPAYADAHVNLGVALVRRGQYDDAIFHYRLALAIKPGLESLIRKNIEIAEEFKSGRRIAE